MKNKGFTLIELLVVVAIIGIMASVVLASLNDARASARDTVRIQDMKQLHTAFELFYNDNNRYPGPIDGVSNNGQMLGVGNPIDAALRPYLDPVPKDPLHDAGNGEAPTAGAVYFYSYDPRHWLYLEDCGQPTPAEAPESLGVFGFNKSEVRGVVYKETCHGTHMNLDNADYNKSLQNFR